MSGYLLAKNSLGNEWRIEDPSLDCADIIEAAIDDLQRVKVCEIGDVASESFCALNDCGSSSWPPPAQFFSLSWAGTVWVYLPCSIGRPIRLRRDLHLDFLGNRVTLLGSDHAAFQFGELCDGCDNAHLRNVTIIPNPGSVSLQDERPAMIEIQVGESEPGAVRYGSIEKVHILATVPGQAGVDGIRIENSRAAPIQNHSERMLFRDISMEEVRCAIRFRQQDSNEAASYHYDSIYTFDNIFVDGFETLVFFDFLPGNPNPIFTHHLYDCVFGVARNYTKWGFRDIVGTGDHFDHCGIIDWELMDPSENARRSDWYMLADVSGDLTLAPNSANLNLQSVHCIQYNNLTYQHIIVDAPCSHRNLGWLYCGQPIAPCTGMTEACSMTSGDCPGWCPD